MKKYILPVCFIFLSLITFSCGSTKSETVPLTEVPRVQEKVAPPNKALMELSNSPRHHE